MESLKLFEFWVAKTHWALGVGYYAHYRLWVAIGPFNMSINFYA